MNTIDNTNLLNMCRDCGAVGFIPSVSYAYDAVAETVTVTNASTIPADDALSVIKIRVHDFFGKEVRSVVPSAAPTTPVVVDVSDLDNSKGLSLTVTIFTDEHIAADGGAYGLQAAGNVGNWDVQKNA